MTPTHTHTHTHHIRMHTQHTYIHTHTTHTHIYTYTHTYIHTYTHSQRKVTVHYLYYFTYSMIFPSVITFYNTGKKNRQAKRTGSTVSTTYVACIYINSHRQKLQAVHNRGSSRAPLKCFLLDNCYKKMCNSTVLHPIRMGPVPKCSTFIAP